MSRLCNPSQSEVKVDSTLTTSETPPIPRQKILKKKISHLEMNRPYLIFKAEFRKNLPCLTLNETFAKGEEFLDINTNFLLYLDDNFYNRTRVVHFESALEKMTIFLRLIDVKKKDPCVMYSYEPPALMKNAVNFWDDNVVDV